MSLLGSIMGTDKAARVQSAATREGMAQEREMFDISRGDMQENQARNVEYSQPYRDAGLAGMQGYQDLVSQGFQWDPSQDQVYNQRVGEQAGVISGTGAGRGTQLSGRTLGQLSQMTGQELGQSYDRSYRDYTTQLGAQQNLMSVGQNATNALMGAGQQGAMQLSNLAQGHGQSMSQGHQNLGQIGAAAATAPFSNLMSLGTMAGGMMMGYGALP